MVAAMGCQDDGPARKETVPAKGVVYVDGQPAEGLRIQFHSSQAMDEQQPTFSTSYTRQDGSFDVNTYEAGDGIPPGDYALTFMWGQVNPLSMEYSGPDRLKGKYNDPKTSKVKVTVEAGKPVDIGRIELTTK